MIDYTAGLGAGFDIEAFDFDVRMGGVSACLLGRGRAVEREGEEWEEWRRRVERVVGEWGARERRRERERGYRRGFV